MTSVRRNFLLCAGAAAALGFAASAGAETRACADAFCQSELLFAATTTAGGAATAPVSLASPKYGTWGFDKTGMDPSVKPGDDFYRFANGAWDDRTAIPSDRTRYGNFDKLTELSENRVHAIVAEAAAGTLMDRTQPRSARSTAPSWTKRWPRSWTPSRWPRTWPRSAR